MDRKELFEALATDHGLKMDVFKELLADPDLRETLKQRLIKELVGPGEIEKMIAEKKGSVRSRQAVAKYRSHPAFPEPIRLRVSDIYMRDEVQEFLELERSVGTPGQRLAQEAREKRAAQEVAKQR